MIRALRSASFLPLVLVACKKGDKVPAYLNVPSVELTTTDAQGTSRTRVTDAWVYANDELLGCWELPAQIPVLKEGPVTIRVTPGVKRNGTYDDRVAYPFFSSWLGTADLTPTATTSVSPVVEYYPTATFWIEAFVDAGSNLIEAESSDTTLLRFTPEDDPQIVVDGTPCGGFVLDQAHPDIYLYTEQDFTATGGPAFLELDYRCDMQFTVGVLYALDGVAHSDDYVYIAPTTQGDGSTAWNRIYIDLSPVFNTGVSQRDIYISAALPSGQSSGHVYLDNIKLVR